VVTLIPVFVGCDAVLRVSGFYIWKCDNALISKAELDHQFASQNSYLPQKILEIF